MTTSAGSRGSWSLRGGMAYCGTRLLDVACGTGKSFLPLLRGRVERHRLRRLSRRCCAARNPRRGGERDLLSADMRRLPRKLGDFDLVFDDRRRRQLPARGHDELATVWPGLARNLAPGGRVLFDTNTLHMYRTFYSETEVIERGHRADWYGRATATARLRRGRPSRPRCGSRASPELEGTDSTDRHFTASATFPRMRCSRRWSGPASECLSVMGHGLDGRAEQPLDEARHTKAIFVGKSEEGEVSK